MAKIAVVLFNLGGPDSKQSIEPFLMNFFMDKNIIRLPYPFRWLLAKRISTTRSKREASASYSEIGDRSPLLENSQAQANALEKFLNAKNADNTFKVFLSMRYWHPMADEVSKNVQNWNPDKVILLPLYPQFSTTTTWSSFQNWKRALQKMAYNPQTSAICCYPYNEGFIEASAQNILTQYKQAQQDGHTNIRILFSAHGLPEKVVKDGDPYQWQCEQTAAKIVERLSSILGPLDWESCYQSRVGRLKWIGPSTEESIEKAAKENKAIIIYPHVFTQEHVETLVELDIEYKHKAEELGIKGYYRAATVDTNENFIGGLATLVESQLNKTAIEAEGGKCLCPPQFTRCCMRKQLEN